MLTVPERVRVFVAHDPVDFRKSCDGLAAVVSGVLSQDALSGHVFVFFNRHRNRIKILVWERNGYWLHYKRQMIALRSWAVASDGRSNSRSNSLPMNRIDSEGIDGQRCRTPSRRILVLGDYLQMA